MENMKCNVDKIIKRIFGKPADSIRKIMNVTNNTVYEIVVLQEKYILKLYRNPDWPEKGKNSFIYKLLGKHNIPCAELIEFCKNDRDYPAGYLLEREVLGICASQLDLDKESEEQLYTNLAQLMSLIHSISIENFGYIGKGVADYDKLSEFFDEEFDDRMSMLVEREFFTSTELQGMKEQFLSSIRQFDDLPSVLCHGDLSLKNIIIDKDGGLTLIDWDDAMSFNWMADISRMTFWMKTNYDSNKYCELRNTLLNNYYTEFRKDEFSKFESAFHIYVALDSLIYYIRLGDRKMVDITKELLKTLL